MTPKLYVKFIVFTLLGINFLSSQTLSLKVIGETDSATATIDSIGYSTRFENYKSLEAEVYTLKNRLEQTGYIDTNLNEFTRVNDSVYNALFFIGKRIKTIRISYASDFDTDLLKSIAVISTNDGSFDIDISGLEASLNILNQKIAEQGDPFSTLQLVDLKKENDQLISAKLSIQRNQKRIIDKIIVKGYEKFPKSYIKRFLKLEAGNNFNLEGIKEKTKLLENLRFANQIKEPEV